MLSIAAALMIQAPSASSSSSPTTSAHCEVEFVHTPTGAEVADFYPEAAFPQKVTGYSAIDCVVGVDLALTRYVVIIEAPQGYGFGEATVKYFVVNARGKPVDANGASCVGRHVTTSFHWTFT